MKQQTNDLSEEQKKQRKFLLVMPLIILPFLTFLLWSVGLVGGEAMASISVKGLNLQLPDAKWKEDKSWNKLSFYEQADKDSLRHHQALEDDPFLPDEKNSSSSGGRKTISSPYAYNPLPPDSSEYKVNQKLAQLNAVLTKNSNEGETVPHHRLREQSSPQIPSNEVDRLENMLQAVNQPDSTPDPETEQLNNMMDKILDIQHPERVAYRLEKLPQKNKTFVYPVIAKDGEAHISLLQPIDTGKSVASKVDDHAKENGFYSLTNDMCKAENQNAIEALVEETQTVESGSIIKLSLQNDVYINGRYLPKGSPLYGSIALSGERLGVSLTSVRIGNSILPVALQAYDLDGLAGIYIPGSINRDVAKQSGRVAINTVGIASLDPSLGAQAASAGIAAAKSLVNKKVRQVKLTIPSGYKLLLKEENQK